MVALVTLFPILWMVSTAFKPPGEIYSLTPHPLPVHPTLSNFAAVINGHAAGLGISFWTFARNSLYVTVVTVVLASVVSLLAAVAVARFRFRFRASYLVMLLIVQMLPAQALVIPLFIDYRGIGLLDNLTGLILIYSRAESGNPHRARRGRGRVPPEHALERRLRRRRAGRSTRCC